MHDQFRVNWSGRSSHAKTVEGMRRLAEAEIKFKVIAVVTEATLADPEGFFEFFWSWRESMSGFHFNILASGDGSTDARLRYSHEDRQRYLSFYKRLIDLARERRAAENGFAIQNFTQALRRILAPRAPGQALYCEECSAPLKSLNVDTRGNVTTFYAGLAPEKFPSQYGDDQGFALGNLWDEPLEALVRSSKLQRMIADFAASNAACAAVCPYHTVCSGGFELTKLSRFGHFEVAETPECVIHVKTLIDALVEDMIQQSGAMSGLAGAGRAADGTISMGGEG